MKQRNADDFETPLEGASENHQTLAARVPEAGWKEQDRSLRTIRCG
jgi:hypothetical protein